MRNMHAQNKQQEIPPHLIDIMPQGIATLNEEGVILYCNPSFSEMVNLPWEKVVGTKFDNYIADSSKEHFKTLYEKSWSEPIKDEIHLNDHIAMVMPVLLSAAPFEKDNKKLLSIVLTDISEHNKNQNELKSHTEELEQNLLQLKESEERFRLIVENVKDYSIVMLDPDGNVITWNKGVERIKGYKANEIIGKHISVVYTPEEILNKEPEHNLKMARQLGRYESEGWRVRKDGSMFFADVIITAIYDAENKFQGYAKITRDDTERNKNQNDLKYRTKQLKKKLSELRESEERFRLIVENVKDFSIIMLDSDGNIITWNKGAERIKGYKANEIIGKHVSVLYTPEGIERKEPEHHLKIAKELGRFENEGWRVRKDGSLFFADVIITSIYDADNNFQGYARITRDVTERNKSQIDLKNRTEELEKKLVELLESEERFRLIVDNVKDYSIIMLDPDGYIKTWNKGAEGIKGYKANEIIGKHISVVYTPEEIQRKEPEHNLKMAKEMGRYESEGWRMRKDGSTFFADVIITAIYDVDNKFQGYAKITRDVTARNKSQTDLKNRTKELEANLAELKESEERFRLIVENVKDYSIVMLDPDGNVKTWNKGVERIKGYKANEIIGKHISLVYTPEEILNKEPEHNLKMAKELGRYESEGWRMRKDGSTFFADVIITAIYDANNKFYGYAKITRDITERKGSEEKLKESEERFLKIFDNSPVAMTLSEIKTNKITFANQHFYSTFGYTEGEVIGSTSEELKLMTPEELEKVTALILKYLEEERPISELQSLSVEDTEALLQKLNRTHAMKDFEVQYTKKNGETFYALVFFESIRIGYQSYTITSYQDITDRKISEEKIKQKSIQLGLLNQKLANKNAELLFQIEEKEKKGAELTTANTFLKEKEELIAHKDSILAILSHDLRSPLAGIIGAAEYLQANIEKMAPAEVKGLLGLLYEASTKELNMLDYLVEWARIKYASEVFSPEKIELTPCVQKVFDLLNEVAVKNEVLLHNEVEDHISVWADRKMVLSILQNLLSNAIKHSIPCEVITVSAKKEENEIIVQVKDNGIGMNKQTRERLFTPQIDSLSKGREGDKGAGIGLLLVKGFLEKNGGRIWVESEEGMGSTFYFTLPINKPVNSDSN